MKKKTPIERNIKSIIKSGKSDRHESQRRVFEFSRELSRSIEEERILFDEIKRVQEKISRNRHLIEMYSVMDRHELMDIWKLEKAIGIASDNYPQWESKFFESKDGFEFKKHEDK